MNIRFAVADDEAVMVNHVVSLVREWADEYGKYHELWNA